MYSYIETLKNLLTKEDEAFLKKIYAPTEVAAPYSNAVRSLCVLPDGEIRCYGEDDKTYFLNPGTPVYISSRDCGLSWKKHYADPLALGTSVRSPFSGRYLVIRTKDNRTCAFIASHPDSQDIKYVDICEMLYVFRPPMPLSKKNHWICMAQVYDKKPYHPVALLSDDDGESWRAVHLESAPKHEIAWPHEGYRWQNYSVEPTVAELSDGTLMLISRTATDYHYIYYSYDGGESWTKPVPSPFYGTNTMPTLLRLSDGRILFLWCNTRMLPELCHEKQWPPLNEGEISGEEGEDVFTNRDANHVAISEDDGKTWIGFREMVLNSLRNEADFRTHGGNDHCLDKSVHQFQAIELPFGKILLHYGQNPVLTRIIIFDINWIYEKTRTEDFKSGLINLSTQVYLKSVSGNFRGFSGHCAWNRRSGAVLVPDPSGDFTEALSIARIHDDRLLSDVQGAVWNFPASDKGEVLIKMRIDGEGLRITLADCWFNPIDVTVEQLCPFSFALTKEMLDRPESDTYADVKIVFGTNEGKAAVYSNDRPIYEGKISKVKHGLSYLHLQSLAAGEDKKGALIKRLEKR